MTSLREEINTDFMIAFKSGDAFKKTLLGVLKGEIANEVSRGVDEGDSTDIRVIKAMIKSARKMGTTEAEQEIEILNAYLPELMSDEAIRTVITTELSSAQSIGEVMKHFKIKYNGLADNATVSKIAREELLNK